MATGKASLWNSASCVTIPILSDPWITNHLPQIENKPLCFPADSYFLASDPFKITPILHFTTN